MKIHSTLIRIIFPVIFLGLFLACDSDGFNNNNPYLPNYRFSYDLNMNLPLYSSLQFPSNGVVITQPGIGVRGIIVFNAGGNYVAYDAGCPNQPLAACSTLTISGINALCPCDEESYSLFTGLSTLPYPLKPYRIDRIGQNMLRIYN